MQSADNEKIWQLRKQHSFSGELFCTKIGKYIDKGEEKKMTFKSDLGKRWQLVIGRY